MPKHENGRYGANVPPPTYTFFMLQTLQVGHPYPTTISYPSRLAPLPWGSVMVTRCQNWEKYWRNIIILTATDQNADSAIRALSTLINIRSSARISHIGLVVDW